MLAIIGTEGVSADWNKSLLYKMVGLAAGAHDQGTNLDLTFLCWHAQTRMLVQSHFLLSLYPNPANVFITYGTERNGNIYKEYIYS